MALTRWSLAERLGSVTYASDKDPHLTLSEPELCRRCTLKPCIRVCPAEVYQWANEEGRLRIRYENCLELGACRIACTQIGNGALRWEFPRGSKGVTFRYG
jgi:ferredoxin like protein